MSAKQDLFFTIPFLILPFLIMLKLTLDLDLQFSHIIKSIYEEPTPHPELLTSMPCLYFSYMQGWVVLQKITTQFHKTGPCFEVVGTVNANLCVSTTLLKINFLTQ